MRLFSKIKTASEDFMSNQSAHLESLDLVRSAAELAAAGGGEKARQRHLDRGKMLPRARVANLLDYGSSFLEIGATAAHGLYNGDAPSAGLVAGIGQVHGLDRKIIYNDETGKGGTYNQQRVEKK